MIAESTGQRVRQAESHVCCPQQEPSSVGAASAVITLDDDRLADKLGEQQTLCRVIFGQAGTSFGVEKLFRTSLS